MLANNIIGKSFEGFQQFYRKKKINHVKKKTLNWIDRVRIKILEIVYLVRYDLTHTRAKKWNLFEFDDIGTQQYM